MSDEARKPWEQQETEPPLWFDRFWKYCQLGSKRTLIAVYRKEARKHKSRKGARKSVRSGVPGAWSEAATQWHWQSRAEAWDGDQRAQMTAQYEKRKAEILSSGFALNFIRIEALTEVATLLQKELKQPSKRWLPDVKGVGQGENFQMVDIVRFNAPIIQQFRETLDDIAIEMGDRVRGVKLSGNVTTTTVSVEDVTNAKAKAEEWRAQRFGKKTDANAT